MDFKTYYLNQIGGNYMLYQGGARQRGYGIGGVFKSMFKYLIPLFRTHALPTIKKGAEIVGNEAIRAVGNIATDAIKGQNLKDSIQQHASNAVENLTNQVQAKFQSGSGKKRKYSLYNTPQKKALTSKRNSLKKVKFDLKPKIRKIEDIFG